VHQQNSDLLHPKSSKLAACQPKTDTSRTLPAHSTTVSTNLSAWGPKPPAISTLNGTNVAPSIKSRCALTAPFHRAHFSRSPSRASLHGVYEPTALLLSLWSFHAVRVSVMNLVVHAGS
jgi:hypothetical protein